MKAVAIGRGSSDGGGQLVNIAESKGVNPHVSGV